MKNIVLVGYREWAINVINKFDGFTKILSKDKWDDHTFNKHYYYIFIGWSWIISKDYIKYKNCLCIHPSNLPNYRGGSPIQNQVIDGLKTSSVTLFKMNEKLDAGPIFDKVEISLKGYLNDIFKEIERASIILIERFVNASTTNNIKFNSQNSILASYCKRRKPEQSIISVDELESMTAKQIYDMVRCLQDPYPSCAIRLSDGSKIVLKQVDYEN